VKEVIPNPLDRESTLTGLSQKSEVLKELVGFPTILKNLIFLIIAGIFLVAYVGISPLLIGIIFGVEIIIQFVFFSIKSSKIKAIYGLNNNNFKLFVVKKAYYDLIHSVVGFFSDCLVAIIILILLMNPLNYQQFFNLPPQTLVFIMVVFRFFEIIINWIQYRSYLKIEEKKTFAEVNQQVAVIEKKLGIVKFVPQMSVFLFFFAYFGIPLYIIAIAGCFLIIMIIISVIEVRRISKVQLAPELISQTNEKALEIHEGEEILGAVYGIMNTHTTGISILGVGKMNKTENTMLITKDRLLFVQIPVTGGSNIVAGTNYSQQNFFWNRGEIVKKGTELSENGLQNLLNSVPYSYEISYEKIKSFVLDKFKVNIETTEGKKFSYAFMDKENHDLIQNLLQNWANFSMK
jgi:hypothetical protein